MSQFNHFVKKGPRVYRSLVVTALLANGIFQFVAPVLAQSAPAGQTISNTATATYQDPNGQTLNATSNTVIVTVAEVAGITITGNGFVDQNQGTVVSGDQLYYNFTLKNVGNDPTKFHIPASNNVAITGPGTVVRLEYSLDGTNNWTPINDADTPSIAADASIFVRAVVTVNNGATAAQQIRVTLGDTTGNPGTQNQPRINNVGDVYTVDNTAPLPPGEVAGNPANGVREASAFVDATVNASSYTFATILKTPNGINDAGTAKVNDDTLTYGLSLRVESVDPTGKGINPAALTGTLIKGLAGPRILISDAIPLNTQLAAVPTNVPSGWQAVYTTDPVSINANAATWQLLTASTDLTTVTRVGFVNNPAANLTSVAPNTTVTGFSIQVRVRSTFTGTSLKVNNIAQLFGQSSGIANTDTNNDGIPDTYVYDESGDQNPSNYNGTTPPGTDNNNDGLPDAEPTPIDDGYIANDTELANAGTDPGNNQGQGPGGEASSTIVTQVTATVLNGPENAPDAIGPGNDPNTDFSNKSSAIPVNTKPGATIDPAIVTFNNTVKNTSTLTNDISLLPTPPANTADLPTGTTVTIRYQNQTKAYTWNGTQFLAGGAPIDDTTDYITIADVLANGSINYSVDVDLPSGTNLSTDDNILRGYPVPITAFVDDTTPGLSTETGKNTTILRVYTGFLKLVKESRVLQGTGPAVGAGQGDFSTTPAYDPDGNGALPSVDPNPNVADVPRTPAQGNVIEYRIRYRNISEAQPTDGNNNLVLTANNIVITEDGALSTTPGDGLNNWAVDSNGDGQIDTSNVAGSANDSGTATILFFNQNTPSDTNNANVTRYVDNAGNIAPGVEQTFSFQRRVN
ncbi:MAG: hypothetical protein NHB32_04475 [Fischerella sp. CENA71]|nr:hypothetical protein [Fischerella sp. CENA71]